MNATQQSILLVLRELEVTVAALRTKNVTPKPDLMPLFAKLDQLTASLPKDTDPTFLHYMHKKSYQKARLFLEGKDAENQAGNCRHV